MRSGEAEGVSAVRASIGALPTTFITSAFAVVTNLTGQTLPLILLLLVNMTMQLIICAFVVHDANSKRANFYFLHTVDLHPTVSALIFFPAYLTVDLHPFDWNSGLYS